MGVAICARVGISRNIATAGNDVPRTQGLRRGFGVRRHSPRAAARAEDLRGPRHDRPPTSPLGNGGPQPSRVHLRVVRLGGCKSRPNCRSTLAQQRRVRMLALPVRPLSAGAQTPRACALPRPSGLRRAGRDVLLCARATSAGRDGNLREAVPGGSAGSGAGGVREADHAARRRRARQDHAAQRGADAACLPRGAHGRGQRRRCGVARGAAGRVPRGEERGEGAARRTAPDDSAHARAPRGAQAPRAPAGPRPPRLRLRRRAHLPPGLCPSLQAPKEQRRLHPAPHAPSALWRALAGASARRVPRQAATDRNSLPGQLLGPDTNPHVKFGLAEIVLVCADGRVVLVRALTEGRRGACVDRVLRQCVRVSGA
eukprot:3830269-Rhodomonas_salina.5